MKRNLFCTKCFNDEDFEKTTDTITHEIKDEKYLCFKSKSSCKVVGMLSFRLTKITLLNAFTTVLLIFSAMYLPPKNLEKK